MNDISGFGLSVRVLASNTFPAGFTVTEFADDADPLDIAAAAIADKAMGLNGHLITWSKATPIPAVINTIPGSDADTNLAILLEANRVGKGKRSAKDVITLVVSYPDGGVLSLLQGRLIEGMSGRSVASAGRQKTRPYTFSFENKAELPPGVL